MTTIRDVAREACVSVASASRALNAHDNVAHSAQRSTLNDDHTADVCVCVFVRVRAQAM